MDVRIDKKRIEEQCEARIQRIWAEKLDAVRDGKEFDVVKMAEARGMIKGYQEMILWLKIEEWYADNQTEVKE